MSLPLPSDPKLVRFCAEIRTAMEKIIIPVANDAVTHYRKQGWGGEVQSELDPNYQPEVLLRLIPQSSTAHAALKFEPNDDKTTPSVMATWNYTSQVPRRKEGGIANISMVKEISRESIGAIVREFTQKLHQFEKEGLEE